VEADSPSAYVDVGGRDGSEYQTGRVAGAAAAYSQGARLMAARGSHDARQRDRLDAEMARPENRVQHTYRITYNLGRPGHNLVRRIKAPSEVAARRMANAAWIKRGIGQRAGMTEKAAERMKLEKVEQVG
jgi:hypothetical protein